MYLKQLELYGFKSFGERVKMDFNHKLTAIVGPNGSGKSNIVDSVRWLLGDQSYKSLRVPSSEEVIYKGENNATPFNFSYVSMVIELDDDDEVQIERKYHRSGENDYLLNGKRVRMKDIRHLMRSKGFGLDSLSILSQGQIDSILSLVPTDRRVVLEEVAQITHFKDNKTRILKKLDATRDNLTRLDDILREVDSRIKELKEQAEMARRFRQLDVRRKELEVDLAFKETERFVKNIRRNLADLHDKEQELFDLKRQSSECSALINKIESEIERLREHLDREMDKSKQRSLELEKVRSSLDLAQNELESWIEKRAANRQSMTKLSNEIAHMETLLSDEKHKLEKAIRDKNDAEKRLADTLENAKMNEANENALLSKIEQRSSLTSKLKTDVDLLAGHISMLEDRLKRAQEYLEEGDEAFSDRTIELERFHKRAEEFKTSLKTLRQELNTIEKQRDECDISLQNASDEIDKVDKELTTKRDELIGIVSELKILNDLEKRLAGYHAGVKRLMEARDQNKLTGVIAPVIDLIDVEKGFERSVEAALAGRGQYIVVETFNDGLNALKFLKNTGGGRVTFIPLDDFNIDKHSSDQLSVPESEGYQGKATDRISVDDRFKPVLEYLLRDTLVFNDLNSARNARKKFNLKQWIVTLDGEVHQPGGIFTGGIIDHRSEGPLVRRSQIEELERQKHDGEILISSLLDRINSAKALRSEHQIQLRKLQDELLLKKEEINNQTIELNYNSEIIKNHEKEITELKGKREKIENEINAISSELTEAHNRMKQLETELDESTQEAEHDEARKNQILQNRSLREDGINRLRILISSKEQEIVYLNNTIADLENRLGSFEDESETIESNLIDILSCEEDCLAKNIKLKYHYKAESEKAQSESSSEVEIRKNIEEKRHELTTKRNSLVELSAKIEEIDARRETQSLRVAKMESELVAVLRKIADIEKVKTQFPDLLNTDSEDFNSFLESEFVDNLPPRKTIVGELNEIQQQIDDTGEVNVLAERDYENYLRRRDFLNSQKDDLVKAADELMKTLSEIEGESKKAFKEIFEKTRENFQKIFSQLFPGGSADLLLSDPHNLLESGLDIRVKFPGKKELDLLQFSGGERSIIAIAFLFAVLKTKPPSFVILDEVEAALDDVNVENFIKLIRSMDNKFQFIIVTHNKLTMEYASDLWGVTMKKGGMSQVVNISLEDWVRKHPETVN